MIAKHALSYSYSYFEVASILHMHKESADLLTKVGSSCREYIYILILWCI